MPVFKSNSNLVFDVNTAMGSLKSFLSVAIFIFQQNSRLVSHEMHHAEKVRGRPVSLAQAVCLGPFCALPAPSSVLLSRPQTRSCN